MTEPPIITPPESVKIMVSILGPISPVIFTAAVVLIVRSEEPAPVPYIVVAVTGEAAPVPRVSVNPTFISVSKSVIAPVEAPPITESAVIITSVTPRLIAPVPVVERAPAIFFEDWVAAIIPPAKTVLSVSASPTTRVPVLARVVVPAMLFEAPVKLIL